MEQQREPELTQQRQTVKEGAPFEAAPAHTTQTAGSAEPVGEAPGYGLSDPRTLPQDAPTRGGNLPGETAGSRVPEQQQYEQREQQQEVLPVRHAEQREVAQPQQEQRVLPAQHEQPVVQQQQQQPVPVAAVQQQQRHEDVVEDVASDDEESSSTGETEPVTHLQRDNAQAIKTKLTEMDNVREFEAKREAYYKDQYRSHVGYWQALGDTMRQSGDNTARLTDYYSRRTAAFRSFADSLFALNDSVSGDKHGATRHAAHKGELFSARADKLQHQHEKKGSAKPLGAAGATGGDGHIIDELCGSDCESAREIDMFGDAMEKNEQKLKALHEQSVSETNAIVKEGEQALHTLEGVDAYTVRTYEARHRTASESMLRPTEYMGDHSQDSSKSDKRAKDESSDVWLADMNYRVAVRQQKEAWENIAAILERLFDRLRDIEINRKAAVKAILEETVNFQGQLWGKLPSTHGGLLQALGKLDLNPHTLERSIKEEIRLAAAGPDARNVPSQSELAGDRPPTQADASFVNELPAPLDSPFIVHTGVIERKHKGPLGTLTSHWVPTLAVLTSDNYLHLFDCPKSALNADPKTAFDAVLPSIEVASKFRSNKEEKKAMVSPTLTLDLTDHIVGPRGKQTKPEHAREFHVYEVKQNHGLKGIFKDESKTKAPLKAQSESDKEQWLRTIKSLDTSAAPSPHING